MQRKNSGYTLVELLIVIAMLALMAAMLFPVFAQARAKARTTVCASNLRQIGQAMAMYAPDYDGVVPLWGRPRGQIHRSMGREPQRKRNACHDAAFAGYFAPPTRNRPKSGGARRTPALM